jgi:uncharacterized membrane protein YadS
MTMCALGLETGFSRLKQVDPAPIYLAAVHFVRVLGFGYFATRFFIAGF